MEGSFEVLLKGTLNRSARTKVKRILSARCGIALEQVEKLLDSPLNPQLSIMRSDNRSELEVVCREISAAGGKVIIVRTGETEAQQPDFSNFYRAYVTRLSDVLQQIDPASVEALIDRMLEAREDNRQIFIFGNGGSAANASHWTNDFTKQRSSDESKLFRVISLTDNMAWFSATANDFGYDAVFTQQLKNLLQPDDVVIAISSSGNSANIVQALEYANNKGATTFAVVGFTGGQALEVAQHSLYIPSKTGEYGFMEDACSILGHMITSYLEMRDKASRNP